MGTRPSEPACFALYPPWAYSLPLPPAWHARHSLSRSERSNEVVELAADSEAIFCSAFARMSLAMVAGSGLR